MARPRGWSIRNGMKKCRCPLHWGENGEGTWLPVSEFRIYRSGKRKGQLLAWCLLGTAAKRNKRFDGQTGYVPTHRVYFAVRELVAKIGKAETVRRTEIDWDTLKALLDQEYEHCQKRVAAAIFRALYDVREKGEVRHRDSIIHGAAVRGRLEKVPKTRDDFYDKASEHEQELDRARHRRGRELTSE